jgi:putative transposase
MSNICSIYFPLNIPPCDLKCGIIEKNTGDEKMKEKTKKYPKEEVNVIRKLLRTTKKIVMYRKYLVIRLHMKGLTNQYIANIVDLDRQTVGIYIKTYKEFGVDGLIPKKSPGRPTFLTPEQEKQVYESISKKTPEDVGFDGVKNWTAKFACLWVSQEFGIQYSVNGMLDLFNRLNLSFTRPTYVLANADPEKQKQFVENFNDVKKTVERRY